MQACPPDGSQMPLKSTIGCVGTRSDTGAQATSAGSETATTAGKAPARRKTPPRTGPYPQGARDKDLPERFELSPDAHTAATPDFARAASPRGAAESQISGPGSHQAHEQQAASVGLRLQDTLPQITASIITAITPAIGSTIAQRCDAQQAALLDASRSAAAEEVGRRLPALVSTEIATAITRYDSSVQEHRSGLRDEFDFVSQRTSLQASSASSRLDTVESQMAELRRIVGLVQNTAPATQAADDEDDRPPMAHVLRISTAAPVERRAAKESIEALLSDAGLTVRPALSLALWLDDGMACSSTAPEGPSSLAASCATCAMTGHGCLHAARGQMGKCESTSRLTNHPKLSGQHMARELPGASLKSSIQSSPGPWCAAKEPCALTRSRCFKYCPRPSINMMSAPFAAPARNLGSIPIYFAALFVKRCSGQRSATLPGPLSSERFGCGVSVAFWNSAGLRSILLYR